MNFKTLYIKFPPRFKTRGLATAVFLLLQLCVLCSEAYYLDGNPYRHKQVLGPKASYVVEWTVNWKENSITFQVSAETKGWIGFGLSRDGRMTGSDVVVGGVSPSGKPYFNDAHVKGNRSVQIDDHEDWRLLGAWEKGKRTYLSFSRPLDTCDLQDHAITSDLIVLIWAYGESDTVSYHMKRRGSYPVYLLDPEISSEIAHDHYRQIGPHSNTLLVQRWAITNTLQLPARPTSVWCSIHRGPSLAARHDIVGMGAFLPNRLALRHVHHMIIYKCTNPQSASRTFFEPYVRSKGEECYLNENRAFPLAFCREMIFAWGRGGRPFYFPEHIGIPIGESPEEYFLLETHYDNVKSKRNVEFEAGIEIIFSHRQKANQASLLQIGYGPFGTFMLPPQSVMNIYGSCGPKCTGEMFPKDGANAFAVMLHSHLLGRRIRLQHFRGGREREWILKDDNYDSEFQQMRLLRNEITILPSDQLTAQCTFDSYERNRTTFSGFSNQDETCLVYVYVNRRIPFFRCTSEYPADRLFSKYGVNNFTWDLNWYERYVTSPKQMEGTWLGDVVDESSQWRHSNPEQLQQEFQASSHFGSCPDIRDMMKNAQAKLMRTFTSDWGQQPLIESVATRTPYLSSSVTYPMDIPAYQQRPYCQSYEQRPRPIASLRPHPTSRHPAQKLPNPPSSRGPVLDYSFATKQRPSHPSSTSVEHSNEFRIPPSSTSTSVEHSSEFRAPPSRPLPTSPSAEHSSEFRIPPSPTSPSAEHSSEFKVPPFPPLDINSLIDGDGGQSGPDYKIPMIRMRTTERPDTNFFHQLANMIHPPSTSKPKPTLIFKSHHEPQQNPHSQRPQLLLFQNNIRIDDNVLKKRADDNRIVVDALAGAR